MRGNEFLDKMALIDPAYVEAAEVAPKRKSNKWVKWGAMAACFCVIATAAVAIPKLTQTEAPEPIGAELPAQTAIAPEPEIELAEEPNVSAPVEASPKFDSEKPQEEQTEGEFHSVEGLEIGIAPLAPEAVELTLSEAQADADFGAYMLNAVPSGFEEESIHRYKDQNFDSLSGLWTNGYDELRWQVTYFTEEDASRLTGIDETENYDLSLYPIPRADSVPEELREIVDDPIFLAEELTLDAVYARAYKSGESGDSTGWRMRFSVKYGDCVVKISAKGVEPDWVYQQLIGLLEK